MDGDGKFFAYHTTKSKTELQTLSRKYLSMKGITVEIKKKELSQ
tara:strand:+ start:373 stop:504 length:132 start_codon:yes stop_codon:yes gene_type:complete